MKEAFINALEARDISRLVKIPKGDLHNHAPRGGNVSYIEEWVGVKISPLTSKFNDLGEMQQWYEKNIKVHCTGIEGYEIRIKAAFDQAKRDGVTKLVLTFGLGEEEQYGSLRNFTKTINDIHKRIAPDINFIPEIAIGSTSNVSEIYNICQEYFNYGFYKSIDINGPEMVQPPATFKPLYRLAKSCGMRLRAHVGEFGNAYSVREAVEVLELDEVQHGIAAADCKHTIKWLANNNIQMNICPASNIILNRAQDYKSHPIRAFFDEGVRVTINTDDMIIFNVSLTDMFMHFYNDEVFTAEELNVIRECSIT